MQYNERDCSPRIHICTFTVHGEGVRLQYRESHLQYQGRVCSTRRGSAVPRVTFAVQREGLQYQEGDIRIKRGCAVRKNRRYPEQAESRLQYQAGRIKKRAAHSENFLGGLVCMGDLAFRLQ